MLYLVMKVKALESVDLSNFEERSVLTLSRALEQLATLIDISYTTLVMDAEFAELVHDAKVLVDARV